MNEKYQHINKDQTDNKAPDSFEYIICAVNKNGIVKKVNQSIKALGYSPEELIGRNFIRFEDRQRSNNLSIEISDCNQTTRFENWYIKKDGEIALIAWTVTWDENNKLFNCIGKNITDISDRVDAFTNDQKHLIDLFLNAPVLMCIFKGENHTFKMTNPLYEKLTGRSDFVGKTIRESFPEVKDQGIFEILDTVYKTGETFYAREIKVTINYGSGVLKNLKDFYLNLMFQPIKNENGAVQGIFYFGVDVTEQVELRMSTKENELNVRNFAKQLNQVLEDERSRISREIHDEFGQQLAGVKMSLASFKYLQKNPKAIEVLNDLILDVDSSIKSLRKFATDLRPAVLDTLGLAASIEWLIKEFEKKNNIKINYQISLNDYAFKRVHVTSVFRICQESLTNIQNHSEATQVSIKLTLNENNLSLLISDNGRGIPDIALKNPGSIGLLGMRERAKLINATLSINTKINIGTTIKLNVNVTDEI